MSNFSFYHLLRLDSLVSLAMERNIKYIEDHNTYLRSFSEDELHNLSDFDLNYSSFLEKDNDFLLELRKRILKELEKNDS